MSRRGRRIAVCAALAFWVAMPCLAGPPDGGQLVREQARRNAGFRDERSSGTITLLNSKGAAADTREFEAKRLEGGASQAARSLLTIVKPAELAGVRLLSIREPGKAAEQWIHFPESKQTKRIAGASKGGRFAGSEFSMEDLEPADPERYRYRYLKTETLNGMDCHLVEAEPLDASAYSKTILWLRSAALETVRIDFFGKGGEPVKRALLSDYREVAGFRRPFTVTMYNLKSGRQSALRLTQLKLNTGMAPAELGMSALER